MSIVALVPLRGGSKSIPQKNIKSIAGKPLCAWCLEAAVESRMFDAVYVSTDCMQIAEVVEDLGLGVKVIFRPAEFAADESSTESVMFHFMGQLSFDVLVTIQATSPLLEARDLSKALMQFKAEKYDSMLTAVRAKRFFWDDQFNPINYDPISRPRRQDFCGTLMENGAFYITKRGVLELYNCRLGGKIGVYEMDPSSAIEIDELEDWEPVERLLLRRI